MKKKIKKRGQSVIEFCLCVPIIIMMVLGLYDICIINAMRIELQGFTQRAINAYAINSNWSGGGITEEAGRFATQQTVFCLNSGRYHTENCANQREVTFQLLVPKNHKQQWAAGNIACIKGQIKYDKPLYKAILPHGQTTITATSCSSIEHNGTIQGPYGTF